MGLRRWWRHMSGLASANLRGDTAAATMHRREAALLAIDGEADTLTFRRDGLTWTTTALRHTITRNLFVHGRHPREEVAALGEWLTKRGRLEKEHPWVVDVGANVGAPTLFFVRDLARRVVAVEPVPETFALLLRNIADNGFADRIVPLNAAVAEKPGTLAMVRHPKDGWSEVATGTGRQAFGDVTPGAEVIDVPSFRLDQIVSRAKATPAEVSFVWSDTQGFETQVLRSGPALWKAGVPAFVEMWPAALEIHGGLDQFVAACREHFRAFVLRDDLLARRAAAEPRPIDGIESALRGIRRQTDGLLLP